MNNGYLPENIEAILEALESDRSDESDRPDERAGRRRYREFRPRTASGMGLIPRRPPSGYVSAAQLEAVLTRVGSQLKTNSEAIAEVNSRLTEISGDISRDTNNFKKDLGGLRNNIQLASLLPLLIKPTTRNVTKDIPDTELKANDKILVEQSDSLSTLLPILLLGGMSTSSDGSSGGSNLNDLILILAVAGGLGDKK
jgi:hypothetical protein